MRVAIPTPIRRKNQKGFVTIEFVLGVAFLILPVTLLVLVLPTWSERQSVARVAARESARSFVLSNNAAQAQEAGLQIADNDKINRESVSIEITGDPTVRGGAVRANVSIEVPLTFIPLLGGEGGGFQVKATHSEVVDMYRSAQ